MLPIYIYSFGSVIVVSLVSLVGIFTLSLKEAVLRKYVFLLVSLAAGALLGDVFIHLLPEAFEASANPTHVSIAVIGGILIFFLLEKFLHWHHHGVHEEGEREIHPMGQMILISDGMHNFIDGLIIGASYLISIEIGIATTLAVILHEIPQEIGDFGVLIHSGYSTAKALLFNFMSAFLAVVGTTVVLLIGNASSGFVFWLLPIAAGGFIYIAMSDLIPEMHKMKKLSESFLQLGTFLIGIIVMLLLLAIE